MFEPGIGSIVMAAMVSGPSHLMSSSIARRQAKRHVLRSRPSSHSWQRAGGAKMHPGSSGSKYSRNQGMPVAETPPSVVPVYECRRARIL